MESAISPRIKIILGLTVLVKLVLSVVFSSGYEDQLFIPFVSHFLQHGGNPWQAALQNAQLDAFPYPPLMLYILSLFMGIPVILGIENQFVLSFFYGLPLLLSDILIFYTLVKMFPWRKTEIYIFFFTSPIIIYSTYMHGQLDIIPTALLLFGLNCLTQKKIFIASIIFGLAIATKFHTIAVLPLATLYLVSNKNYRDATLITLVPILVYLLLASPFLQSSGYDALVVHNQKQQTLFDTYIPVGDLRIYLPVLTAILIYLRFYALQKVNKDLLFAMVGTLFSVFLLLVTPSPGWFVWVVPFFTIFYIRYFNGYQNYLYYVALTLSYLLYFLFFHTYEYIPLTFLGNTVLYAPVENDVVWTNLAFTTMEAILFATIFQFYKNGIRSNQVYSLENAFVMGIGGDSGAGKTTLLESLRRILGNEMVELEGDGDHRWERGDENWKNYTHLNPKANFLHGQADQLAQLKLRHPIHRSDYDHGTGTFSSDAIVRPRNFVLIAGLHPFYLPKMRNVIDLKIFLDLDEGLRRHWKIKRDVQERGHYLQEVEDFLELRRDDTARFIKPQRQFADIVIRYFPVDDIDATGSNNPQLGLEIEINASIPISGFASSLEILGTKIQWEYSDDLRTQTIRFEREPNIVDFDKLARAQILNIDELVEYPHWDTGFSGIVQFIILFVISEMLRERATHHV